MKTDSNTTPPSRESDTPRLTVRQLKLIAGPALELLAILTLAAIAFTDRAPFEPVDGWAYALATLTTLGSGLYCKLDLTRVTRPIVVAALAGTLFSLAAVTAFSIDPAVLANISGTAAMAGAALAVLARATAVRRGDPFGEGHLWMIAAATSLGFAATTGLAAIVA
ncbi:MAG: hypothetical protein J0H98_07155 [Solirubrobacterales bacterium]|nr:hypothetical protein [Solirubrobacterales bacterium]